jgi:hypothetical protein
MNQKVGIPPSAHSWMSQDIGNAPNPPLLPGRTPLGKERAIDSRVQAFANNRLFVCGQPIQTHDRNLRVPHIAGLEVMAGMKPKAVLSSAHSGLEDPSGPRRPQARRREL